MQSLWNDQQAQSFMHDPLQLRVYTSRLLGQMPELVLHGGGNTSVKAQWTNLFGESEEVLYVKGSGWDLASIEAPGFAPVRLEPLQRMAELAHLSDSAMVRAQRAAMTDPYAPNPSVEAILHAILPFRFVDHTHADAVVMLSNTPSGPQRIQALYGEDCLIVPYVMPGFVLAKTVWELSRGVDWTRYCGMILLHHGVFSFADDGRESYERMIRLVDRAEQALRGHSISLPAWPQAETAHGTSLPSHDTLLALARLRKAVATQRGNAVIARWNASPAALAFSNQAGDAALRGPLTPDHVIRTKRTPMVAEGEAHDAVARYVRAYRDYFERNADAGLTCLNPAPCWAVWPGHGTLSFDRTDQDAGVIHDITAHTLAAITAAEQLEAWQALPERDIFAVEYWELEQAKLRKTSAAPPLMGKIALVTGAASGIGKACVEVLHAQGAAVVAVDLNSAITQCFHKENILALRCDVTDADELQEAVARAVTRFGGLDIVIANAGIFPPSALLEDMPSHQWDQSMAVNLTAHQRLLTLCAPYLKLGVEPAIVMIASKNVPAPGPGAAAYSVAKAGQTQLARVAALELGKFGVRVNTLHPNAVFDTAIWTAEVLEKRAKHYGMSVEEYKTNNVLRLEVTSRDVAELAAACCGPLLAKTTGAQIPVDGGNERVI